MVVSEDGEHTITVNQVDERCYMRNSDYEYSYCRALVCKVEEYSENVDKLKLKYLKGDTTWRRDLDLTFKDLEKGEYMIFVELDWPETSLNTNFCVSCYGASRAVFLRDENSVFEKADLLRKAYASKCEFSPDGVKVQTFESSDQPQIKKFQCFNEEGYAFIHYANGSADATLWQKVEFKNFEGLTLLDPEEG